MAELKSKQEMLYEISTTYVIDYEGPSQEKLDEIFAARGGVQLLDGKTDADEIKEIKSKWWREYTLAMQLQLRADVTRYHKY